MSIVDINSVITVAQAAATLVDQMQRDGEHIARSKSNDIDLVTAADVASEKLLRQELGALLPEAGFWGEESNEPPSETLYWLVDPIDGTTNYAHNFPYYCVSVALCREETPILGVIIEGATQRVFFGEQDQGAFLRDPNGAKRPLRVNQNRSLRESILATGFPYHKAESSDNSQAEFDYFLPRCLALRSMGSAALDLAYVAAGSLTTFWEGWLSPWDEAAGALLIREAGGRITDYRGEEWQLSAESKRGMVAMNGESAMHDAILQGIQAARSTLTEHMLDI